jgi:hypothetical protein
MSEGGYGTDNMDWRKLWEETRPQEQVDQVGSVEGDVQGRRDVRQHVEDGTSEPIGQRHM